MWSATTQVAEVAEYQGALRLDDEHSNAIQPNTAASSLVLSVYKRTLADLQSSKALDVIASFCDRSALAVASLHAREPKSDAQLLGTWCII